MNTNEVELKNLYNEEAISKIKKIVSRNSVCMFTTLLDQFPLRSRPMSVLNVCDQGNFWFLSAVESNKNIEIRMDERVQLFFSNSDSEYLSAYGKAYISSTAKKIEELWTAPMNVWFPLGKDDPQMTVIKVTPQDVFYWDTPSGKMISSMKVGATLVAGGSADIETSGKLIIG